MGFIGSASFLLGFFLKLSRMRANKILARREHIAYLQPLAVLYYRSGAVSTPFLRPAREDPCFLQKFMLY
jgi:hypothetical protein